MNHQCRECGTPLSVKAFLCDHCVERFTRMMERRIDDERQPEGVFMGFPATLSGSRRQR